MTCETGGDPPADCVQEVASETCPAAVSVSPGTVPCDDAAMSSGIVVRRDCSEVFNKDLLSVSGTEDVDVEGEAGDQSPRYAPTSPAGSVRG